MPATARVTLTVEVDIKSTWGDDCKLDQIYKQAAEEAVSSLTQHIYRAGGFGGRIKVVGEPNVMCVITTQKDRA
jgi:hypothetical protein